MSEVENVLAQLGERKARLVLRIGRHDLTVTNLDKVLWPGAGGAGPRAKRDQLCYIGRV